MRRSIEKTALAETFSVTAATIHKSGSTNTLSWDMIVNRDGLVKITVEDNPEARENTIPDPLANKFFADLDAAMPINNLPTPDCLKSVSFGTVTTITYNNQTSPDISCPVNDHEKGLYTDVLQMEKLLGLDHLFRHPVNSPPVK
jgi:hypothetical protein